MVSWATIKRQSNPKRCKTYFPSVLSLHMCRVISVAIIPRHCLSSLLNLETCFENFCGVRGGGRSFPPPHTHTPLPQQLNLVLPEGNNSERPPMEQNPHSTLASPIVSLDTILKVGSSDPCAPSQAHLRSSGRRVGGVPDAL